MQRREDRYAYIDWESGLIKTIPPEVSPVKVGYADARRQQLRSKARAKYLRSSTRPSLARRLLSFIGF